MRKLQLVSVGPTDTVIEIVEQNSRLEKIEKNRWIPGRWAYRRRFADETWERVRIEKKLKPVGPQPIRLLKEYQRFNYEESCVSCDSRIPWNRWLSYAQKDKIWGPRRFRKCSECTAMEWRETVQRRMKFGFYSGQEYMQ